MSNFKKFFTQYLLSLIFILTHHTVYANDNKTPVGIFLQSSDIKATDGLGHFEVQTFTVNNEAELTRAQELLQNLIKKDLPEQLQIFEIFAKENKLTVFDQEALDSLYQIAGTSPTKNKSLIQKLKLDVLFNEHLGLTLSLVRFVANTGAVTASMVLGHGVPVQQSLIIGLMAGSFSGLLQYKAMTIGKWITQGKLLINAARKTKISKNSQEQLTQAEHNLQEAEKYIRWGAIETAFLATINTSMILLNLPVEGNFFLTVLKSTASQGLLDIGILNTANYLKEKNPANTARIERMASTGLFLASGVSVAIAASALSGVPMADVGFLAMTVAGLALKIYPRLSESRNKRLAVRSCQMLFQ